jgi:hypothetical protein
VNKKLATFRLGLDPEFDPDPHLSKRLDPDPHIMYADPKHCIMKLKILCLMYQK